MARTVDLESLADAIRPAFDTSADLVAWSADLAAADPTPTWSAIHRRLAEVVRDRASRAVADALTHARDRIERLHQLDDESLDEAIRVMADTRAAAAGGVATAIGIADDRRAILRVIESLGIDVGPALDLDIRPDADAAAQIARRLHLQHREVRLDGRWWTESAGPLLGRRRDDGTPVALIPRRGGYLAEEHRGGEVRRIDPVRTASAAECDDVATMFYRPLPQGAVGVRDLWRLAITGNLGDALTIAGVTLATAGLVALVPILTGMIVGSVIPSFERSQLVFIGAMLVSIAISRALMHVMAGIAFLRIETRSGFQVVAALVDRVLQLPADFFRNASAGDLTQRVMAVEQIRASLTQSILSVLVSFMASIANLGILLHYDPMMAGTAIGLIAVEIAIVAWISVRLARLDYEMSVAKGDLDGFGVDLLMGIRQVRIQGSRNRVLARFLTRLGRVGAFSFRAGVLGVWLNVVVAAASTLALAVVFVEFTDALRVSGGDAVLGAGGFVAFVTALAAFLGAVVGLAPAIKAGANLVPLIHRIRPILEHETEAGEAIGDVHTLRGGVSTHGVRFRYGPDLPWILDGVDIEARPGEFVAIVGRTGCGKSTLLSVLLGLERPESGQVRYDDLPLSNLDATVVRSQVGVVMQSNEVLSGTVQSTILGAGSTRTIDDAWAAARLVGMADEIDAMPMGMLTMVTPSSLSQSQLQRLLIARALVGRPEIVFLDEATSALDNAAQAEITAAIDRLGATRIVIAHRLGTIRRADRIHVLDRGRVVQSGSFEELQAEGGLFADLMAGQVS